MTNYEKVIDPNNLENIIITNSKGNEFELEQVAIIPLVDKVYALLKPLDASKFGLEEDLPLVFLINEDEETLELCVDTKIINKVIDKYEENY